jgi:hypothetical protein
MTPAAVIFLLANSIALLSLPRRWAAVPLLCGAFYVTLGQYIEVGPFTFPLLRILVAVGFVRVLSRRERLSGGMLKVDWLMIVGAAWALLSAFFHKDPDTALVFRMGQVYNELGIYLLIRIFCTSSRDLVGLARIMALLLIPVAVEMLFEQITVRNLFAVLGGVPASPEVREGRIRAQGPFAHAILAGTVGAVTIPWMAALWQTHRKTAVAGGVGCCVMVLAAASSGPILSVAVAVAGLLLWRFRRYMRQLRWCAVLVYIVLDLVMKVPAYYLFFRLKIMGASTGWHRGYLIQQAFNHLPEWWLAGTDYTRHWMPAGVSWSSDHADITNYYLHFGVMSGLPRMLLFIACLWVAFRYAGDVVRREAPTFSIIAFMAWAMGASLASHAATGLSVSYFDQSFVFLYLTLAVIVSLRAAESAEIENSGDTGVVSSYGGGRQDKES